MYAWGVRFLLAGEEGRARSLHKVGRRRRCCTWSTRAGTRSQAKRLQISRTSCRERSRDLEELRLRATQQQQEEERRERDKATSSRGVQQQLHPDHQQPSQHTPSLLRHAVVVCCCRAAAARPPPAPPAAAASRTALLILLPALLPTAWFLQIATCSSCSSACWLDSAPCRLTASTHGHCFCSLTRRVPVGADH